MLHGLVVVGVLPLTLLITPHFTGQTTHPIIMRIMLPAIPMDVTLVATLVTVPVRQEVVVPADLAVPVVPAVLADVLQATALLVIVVLVHQLITEIWAVLAGMRHHLTWKMEMNLIQ